MRRVQNDNSSTSQATRNLATNPEMVAAVYDKVIKTNLATNPSFENPGSLQSIRTNIITNPSFETAGSNFTVRTNLCTNPSMEAGSGTVNVRTNLAPNPSMEATSGTSSVRTNLSTNPNLETGAGGWGFWAGSNGTATGTRQTTGGYNGSALWRVTWTVSQVGSVLGGGYNDTACNPSTVYSVSIKAKANRSQKVRISIEWLNADKSVTVAVSSGPDYDLVTGVWKDLKLENTTSPATAAFARITIYAAPTGTAWLAGDTLDLDAVMVENAQKVGPYFDGATSIANLVGNPSFDVDYVGWAGKGSTLPTLALDTSMSYVGGKSLKVTSNSTVSQGVGFTVSGLTVGKTYTMSGYLWVPSGMKDVVSTVTTIGYGNSVSTKNAWTRSSMTWVATSTTHQVGFDFSGFPAVNDYFYLDAAMLTDTDTAIEYFPNVGDFTYTWTGTANASSSIQQAPGVATYGANNQGSTHWSSSNRAYVGTRSIGSRATGLNSQSGVSAYIPPMAASTTYTLSAWIYIPEGYGAGVSVAAGGSSFTLVRGNMVTTVGTWTRSQVTFTTGATGPFDAYAYVITGSADTPTAGQVFYADAWLLEAREDYGTFFDGNTTATGDFTYAWAGTANASNSYQQAPSVTGWGNQWFGSTGGSGVLYKSNTTGVNGASLRKLWTKANTGAALDTGVTHTISVTGGAPYTFSSFVRSSVATSITNYIIWKDSVGANISNTSTAATTTVTANMWKRVSVSFIAPANAVSATFLTGPYTGAAAMPAGSYIDFDNVMIENSAVLSDYFDGSNPIQNLISNSSFETNTTGWSADTGTPTLTTSADLALFGSKSLKATSTIVSPDVAVSVSAALRAGVTYTMSWYVYSNAARTAFFDVAGTGYNQNNLGAKSVPANTWTRVSATFTTSSNLTGALTTFYLHHNAGPNASGQTIYIDGVLLEATDTLSNYYSGTGDYTYTWNGTANASSSLQQAPTAVGPTLSYYCAYFQSSQWASTGTKSVRIVPNTNANESFFGMVGNFGFMGSFVVGKTYTVSATLRLTAPLTGSLHSRALSISYRENTARLGYVTGTNTAGTQRLKLTFTVAAGTTSAFVEFFNGASGNNGEVWWDDIVVEEGITDGSYFDGSTPAYRNMIANSDAEVDLNGWLARTACTISLSTTNVLRGTKSVLATTNAANNASVVLGNLFNTAYTSVVQGGLTYTGATDFKGLDSDGSVVVVIDWYTDSMYLSASYGSTVSAPKGTIIRPKVTATAPANATRAQIFILYSGYAATGNQFVVDSTLFELGSTSGEYYAGSGDLAYSWSGTAHASTSLARAYGAQTTSSALNVIQSTEWATRQGTKSLRIIPVGTVNDTFSSVGGDIGALRLGMEAGKTYTASAQVRLKGPSTGTLAPNRWARIVAFVKSPTVAGGNYVEYPSNARANVAGVSTVKTTFTLPADTTEAFIRLYNGASGGNGDVWWDDLVVTEGNYSGPYFDGSTSNANGLTYAWTGTANNSTSTQRAMDIAGSYNQQRALVHCSTIAPFSGASSVKGVVTAIGYFPRFERWITPKPGVRYTAIAKMKASAGPVQIALKFVVNPDTYNPVLRQSASNGVWKTVRASEIAPAGSTLMYVWMGVPDSTALGTEFEIDQLMIVEGDYTGPFGTGGSYGWTWEGTPHASTSIGYPVGLAQLAGKPVFFQTTPGTYVLSDVDPAKNPVIAPESPKTIYSVVNVLSDLPTGILNPVFNYGQDNLSDTPPDKVITSRMQSESGTTTNSLLARKTGGSGPLIGGVPSSGKHVFIMGQNELGHLFVGYDNNALVTDTSTSVAIPHERAVIYVNSSYHEHIATYVYPGVHNPAVRQEMIKLLAHEYAIPGM